jgi:hypothetical protein
MAFTEKVYLTAASIQLKKDLFGLLVEEFFNTYTRVLQNDAQFLMEMSAYESFRGVTLWIVECATHIDADVNGSLAPLMRPYRLCHPALRQNRQAHSDLGQQLLEIKTGRLGPCPGMTRVLRLALLKSCNSVDMILVIRQFVQLAMNGVDVCIAHANAEIPPDARTDDGNEAPGEVECQAVLLWAWCYMLDEPYSNVPHSIRKIPATTNFLGNTQIVLGLIVHSASVRV